MKEGKAKIFFSEADDGDEKLPCIIPLKRRKHDDENSNSSNNRKQVLTTISIEEWARLKV